MEIAAPEVCKRFFCVTSITLSCVENKTFHLIEADSSVRMSFFTFFFTLALVLTTDLIVTRLIDK